MKKVILGLSGGVDSAVALVLLKENYNVKACFMRNWDSLTNQDVLGNPTIDNPICPQELDYQDAKKVAESLGIELLRVDFVEEYWNTVFKYFISEYEKGRTPNPDILCNNEIKFKAFLDFALKENTDYIAMGHYAKKGYIDGKAVLLRAKDKNKDQTYFLSQLTEEQLEKALFPIGDLTKKEVREIASEYNLSVSNKKDSMGICFIGERHFNDFLKNYLPAQKGKIRTLDGEYIKDHEGLIFYTIGQRKGLGIGGLKEYDLEPWFVVGKDIKTNTLYVAQGYHNEYLYSNKCIVKNVVWRGSRDLNRQFSAKFRYRAKDTNVTLKWLDEKH